ncbi:MAG: hypothetical protein EOM54_00215 [Clostridia bacterium]|nr:hypothetical protein [Clostridia bacterium]
MKSVLKENKILAAVLLVGFLCALVLCGIRAGIEFRNTHVSVVMSTEDTVLINGTLSDIREFDGGTVLDGIQLLIEDEMQYSYVNDYAPDNRFDNPPLARCFYLYPQFAARYNYLGYPGAEEIENILYRAVTDRNIRVLWLTPFVDAETGEPITDAAVYNDVIENLSARLVRQGLVLGNSFSAVQDYEPIRVLLGFTLMGILAAGVLLLLLNLPISAPASRSLTVLAVAASGVGLNQDFLPFFAFAASVIFPCLALWYMTTRLEKVQNESLSRELGAYAGILFGALGIAIVGGLFVGAVQSSSEYLLAIYNFRGVKLSQILPILFAVYVVLRYLCPPREIISGKKYILILGVVVLCAGAGYYILRTGNANVSVLEQRFRNWLEHVLVVRPRTKEFLVAWPCLAISFGLVVRGKRRYAWPFAILTSVGFASVVNTFCHSRAPLWLSLTRTLLGAIIGAAIGFCIICMTYKKPAAD